MLWIRRFLLLVLQKMDSIVYCNNLYLLVVFQWLGQPVCQRCFILGEVLSKDVPPAPYYSPSFFAACSVDFSVL